MPKVRNDSGRVIPLLRWKILPDSRVISPLGEIKTEFPADMAYSPQAKRLADQKLITIEGYMVAGSSAAPAKKPVAEPVKPAPAPKPAPQAEPDELTSLINIGTGRAKKLKEEGVKSFQDVVDLGAAGLGSLLAIDGQMAEAIVKDAKKKLG